MTPFAVRRGVGAPFPHVPQQLHAADGAPPFFQRRDRRLRELALGLGAVTVACLVFYIFGVSPDKRSYGGVNCGFRWVFWLTPLWLLVMLPAVDYLGRRRWTAVLAAVLLAISVISVSYPTWNPWTSPWLMDWMNSRGWL